MLPVPPASMYHRVVASRAFLFTRRYVPSSARYAVIHSLNNVKSLYLHSPPSRSFSCSRPTFLNSLDTLSDDEEMFRESGTPLLLLNRQESGILIVVTVRRFANDVVAPKVREMDESETMDPEIIKGLFDQGVRLISLSDIACLIVTNLANGY